MDLTIAQTVGVDISKDMLDVHLHPDSLARRFTNSSKGFTALIDWLAQQGRAQRIIFEPTGAYHHAFELAFAISRRMSSRSAPSMHSP